MQETDSARRGELPETRSALEPAPKKGEEMSDNDVAKLIVVKQSRHRCGGQRSLEDSPDDARLFSDGLKVYERELQEVCASANALTCP